MRLNAITLQRYGNYEAERIRFDPTPGIINILLAPNSAGKSVLRNAVADLLFGIHNQTPMDFRFGYSGMQVTAEITRADGTSATFRRRKTRGSVVTDPDDQPLDAGFLSALLGGRDRKFLERLFVLDTEALRQGGMDLLESNGDVASALLSAAGGIRQARHLKQDLERRRDDLAPERRTASRPFYQALDRFLDARRHVASETIRPDAWLRQERRIEELEDQRRDLNDAADKASAEIARLERVRRVRRWLAQLSDATAWLDANPNAPKLAATSRRTLNTARQDIAIKEQAARTAQEQATEAERDAGEIVVNADLLASAEQIKALVDQAGAARKARGDLPGVQAEYDVSLAHVAELLRQMGRSLAPERAAEALPTRALLTRVRQRIGEHRDLDAAVHDVPGLIRTREAELADLERQADALPLTHDPRKLEAVIDEIRAAGDPSVRREEAEKALAESEAAVTASLSRVPTWSEGGEALAALTPPALELWRRIGIEMTTKRGEVAAAEERFADQSAKRAQAESELIAVSHGARIADDEAVTRARAHRDAGWRLIYRLAFTAEPPSAAEQQAFAEDVPLPLAFERAITQADAVADARATDSERTGRREAARQMVSEAERQTAETGERLRLTRESFLQIRRSWSQLLGSLHLPDDAEMADVQAFLGAREQVIQALGRRDIATKALNSILTRNATWADAVAAVLGEAPAALPTLLGLADRALADARTVRLRRAELETLRVQAEKELRARRDELNAAQSRLIAWNERWRVVLTELGRPETETPAETEAVLQIATELQPEVQRMASLSGRIAGMNADIDRFTRSIGELHGGPTRLTEAPDPFEAVRDLDRKLERERDRELRRLVLSDARQKARAASEAATAELLTSRTKLQAILAVIGTETIEDALPRLDLSDERAAAEARRDEAETELRDAGDGHAIDDLRTESGRYPADEDAAHMDAAVTARRDASERAQLATEELSRLRLEMRQRETATGVNDAAADQQMALASLSRTLDDAMLYHTASLLLGRALETVEQSGGSEMLRHVGDIFRTLTGGLYTRIASEPDDTNKADLVMIQRDFPEERQHIHQLSEGTRDQLFLALRVAAIQDHLKSSGPLPFIGDDILQSFDEDRALAALHVLSELSHHTQVIVLTHHRHVMELASRLPDGSVFRCEREPAALTA